MEKLIELLNEWSKTAIKNKCNRTDVYDEDGVYFVNLFDRDMTMEMEDVISKRSGFIRWLVENDKIDRDKVKRESRKFFVGELRPRTPRYKLLILPSISDTPIDFLCEILK